MTHGEKSALGFLGMITFSMWLWMQIEKHEMRARVSKEIEQRQAYLHPKKKKGA